MLFKLQTIALRDEIGVGLFKDKFEMTEHRMQETAGCFSRFTRQSRIGRGPHTSRQWR